MKLTIMIGTDRSIKIDLHIFLHLPGPYGEFGMKALAKALDANDIKMMRTELIYNEYIREDPRQKLDFLLSQYTEEGLSQYRHPIPTAWMDGSNLACEKTCTPLCQCRNISVISYSQFPKQGVWTVS